MSDIETEQVPLLKEKKQRKPRTKKEVIINQEPEPIIQVQEQQEEQKEEYLDTVVPPIKEKKPKTEKQMEAYAKMAEARRLKLEQQKLDKKVEAAKTLLKNGERDDDEQDVEVIYVKPKKAKRK
jgi:hypothetical protein